MTMLASSPLKPEAIGLEVVRPGEGDNQVTMDFFRGRFPAGKKSAFFVHPTELKHILNAHPTPAGIVRMDEKSRALRQRKGMPTLRQQWVQSTEYEQTVRALTELVGTAVVNAHVVRSELTGDFAYGLYPTLMLFPESFTAKRWVRFVRETIERLSEAVRAFGNSTDDWLYGLGALTGIKIYADYFTQPGSNYLTGNCYTGVIQACGLLEVIEAWQNVHQRAPRLGVVGATGSVAMVMLAQLLTAYQPAQLALGARHEPPLTLLGRKLADATSAPITICPSESASESVTSQSDITVVLTSAAELSINTQLIPPHGVIYDPGRPRSLAKAGLAERPDVLALDGASVIIPGQVLRPDLNNYDPEEVMPCMAETAYRTVSDDRDFMVPPRSPELLDLVTVTAHSSRLLTRAMVHGFKPAPWQRWYDERIPNDQLEHELRARRDITPR